MKNIIEKLDERINKHIEEYGNLPNFILIEPNEYSELRKETLGKMPDSKYATDIMIYDFKGIKILNSSEIIL